MRRHRDGGEGRMRKMTSKDYKSRGSKAQLVVELRSSGSLLASPFSALIHELVTHLHQDAFEILAHRHAAQLHAEVADLEARPLRLDLRLLLAGVDGRHLHHQQIEQAVRYQRHDFVAGLEDRENGGGLLGIVQHVHGPLDACKITRIFNCFASLMNDLDATREELLGRYLS